REQVLPPALGLQTRQPIALPQYHPPQAASLGTTAITANPSTHGRHNSRAIVSRHADPGLPGTGFEQVDGDRGAVCAEELGQGGREMSAQGDGVDVVKLSGFGRGGRARGRGGHEPQVQVRPGWVADGELGLHLCGVGAFALA
ncbi:hypothetical protein LTR60_003805, partial [Cryomyces antarcticus]